MKMTFSGGPLNGRAASLNTNPARRPLLLTEGHRAYVGVPGGWYQAKISAVTCNPSLCEMEFVGEKKPENGQELSPFDILHNLKPLPGMGRTDPKPKPEPEPKEEAKK